MRTVGIIAEFNPFHNGHAYFIQKAREITGADRCVVVMSGDFVQRGEPAVCDKYLRTRMALAGGVDAVFELPTAYATASAEIFAEAGIKLLEALGCVDCIAFGSESGDIVPLMKAAEILVNETDEYRNILSAKLKEGLTFPAAREAAFRAAADFDGSDTVLSSPNNILAVEYCKALIRTGSTLEAYTVRRMGSSYNDSVLSADSFPSASAVRNVLNGRILSEDVLSAVPSTTATILTADLNRTLPVTADNFSDILYARIDSLVRTDAPSIADLTPDLFNALKKNSCEPRNFTEFTALLKSKNITYSAVSRALIHIVLDIDTSFVPLLKSIRRLPYARLLGFRTEAHALLRVVSDNPGCTLITKLADADTSDPLLACDIRAAGCYNRVLKTLFGCCPPSEYEAGIVRI